MKNKWKKDNVLKKWDKFNLFSDIEDINVKQTLAQMFENQYAFNQTIEDDVFKRVSIPFIRRVFGNEWLHKLIEFVPVDKVNEVDDKDKAIYGSFYKEILTKPPKHINNIDMLAELTCALVEESILGIFRKFVMQIEQSLPEELPVNINLERFKEACSMFPDPNAWIIGNPDSFSELMTPCNSILPTAHQTEIGLVITDPFYPSDHILVGDLSAGKFSFSHVAPSKNNEKFEFVMMCRQEITKNNVIKLKLI